MPSGVDVLSKHKAKGTRGENQVRDFLRPVFPQVERTGSDHSTEWGGCDLRETGRYGIEVKKWKDEFQAIRSKWFQALRNAGWIDKVPVLVALRHGRNEREGLVVMRLEDWRDLVHRAHRSTGQ